MMTEPSNHSNVVAFKKYTQPPAPTPTPTFKQPIAWATYLFLLLNTAVAVYYMMQGIDFTKLPVGKPRIYPLDIPLYSLSDEPWRLISSMFIHGGLMHFAFNSAFLWMIGRPLESRTGSLRFMLIYLCGGVIASLVSSVVGLHGMVAQLHASKPVDFFVSLGASGAIMALAGAFFVYIFKTKPVTDVDVARRNAGLSSIAETVAINIVFGFMSTGVDNAAHIGGLCAGAVIALVLYQRQRQFFTPSGLFRAMCVLGLTLGSVFGCLKYYEHNADLAHLKHLFSDDSE